MIKTAGTIIGLASTILSAQQFDSNIQKFIVKKQVKYSKNDLIQDILEPVRDEILGLDEGYANTMHNAAIRWFIKRFESPDSVILDAENNWFNDWEKAFQINPTIDLSKKIYSFINSKWNDERWYEHFSNENYITSTILPEITKFMNDLVIFANQNKLFNYNDIVKEISDKTDKILETFNFDQKDDFPGVKNVLNLRQKMIDFLEEYFLHVPLKSLDKPYLSISSNKINLDFNKQLNIEFLDKNLLEVLAENCLEKAKKELILILNNMPDSISADSRFLNVMQSFEDDMPFVFYKNIFGNNSNELGKWFIKWKGIIDVKQSIVKNNVLNKFKINFKLFFKNDFIVSPKEIINGNLGIKINDKDINPIALFSKDMKFSQFLYSTDSLFESISPLINSMKEVHAISKTSFANLVKMLGKNDGDTLENIPFEKLNILFPSIFKKYPNTYVLINDIKNKLKSEYQDASKLAIDFKIVKKKIEDKNYIFLTAFINDNEINELKYLKWFGSATSEEEKKEIINKFIEFDKSHLSKVVPFEKIKLLSDQDIAISELYDYFEKNSDNKKALYNDEINGLKEGDEFKLDDLKNIYSRNKLSFSTFLYNFNQKYYLSENNNNPRFGIRFFVDTINNNKLTIRYEVKDIADNGEWTILTPDGESLNNIVIDINEFASPLDKYLKKIDDMKVNYQERFNSEELCKQFLESGGLSFDDIKSIFPEFENIKNEAIKESVYIEMEKNDNLRWNQEKGCLEQKITLSFNDGNGQWIKEIYWKCISKINVEKLLIKTEIEEAEKIAENAKDEIKEMGISSDKQDEIFDEINKQLEILKYFPGLTNEEIIGNEKKFSVFLLEKITEAIEDKKDEVYELIKKNFNGNVPPSIENLFQQKVYQFPDSLKEHPELLENANELNSFLKLIQNLNMNEILNTTKIMKKNTKIGLSVLGGLLGFGGFVGLGNSVKIATTNKKIGKVGNKNFKIKSGKKLSILSVSIGLVSIIGSISTFIYLFLSQGGI